MKFVLQLCAALVANGINQTGKRQGVKLCDACCSGNECNKEDCFSLRKSKYLKLYKSPQVIVTIICSSYDDLHREVGYSLKRLLGKDTCLKNLRSTFESFIVDTMIYVYSPFTVCLYSFVELRICTPDLTSPGMTGYTLDLTASSLSQQVKFTLPGQLLTHLCFPDCPCWVWHLFPALLCLWTNDFKLTKDGRILPSFYLTRLPPPNL